MKDGWNPHAWNMVADSGGVPVGTFKTPLPAVREELQIIKKFLISISKQKGAIAVSTTEKTNMVWLAGILKMDPRRVQNNCNALIDVGQKSSVQVSIHVPEQDGGGQKELANKMLRFKQGDFIKVVAILRPYGTRKEDGTWKNGISVDVTSIKNDPPQRAREQRQVGLDDDIPF